MWSHSIEELDKREGNLHDSKNEQKEDRVQESWREKMN